MRNNYIQKLISQKIMQQQKKHQTSILVTILVTIFDWDDTLLPTTYLGHYGFVNLPAEVNEQLVALNESAVNISFTRIE